MKRFSLVTTNKVLRTTSIRTKEWRCLSSISPQRIVVRKEKNKKRTIPLDGKVFGDFLNGNEALPILPSSTPSEMNVMKMELEKSLKFHIETYGCQMNKADSEVVRSILLEHESYTEATSYEDANIILINTCAIRENAEDKIWHRLRHLRRLDSSQEQKIAVLGCMAERLKTKLLDEERLVDVVAGPDAYRDLPNLFNIIFSQDETQAMNTQLSLDETYADITPVRSKNSSSSLSSYLSIMRGCANLCSYCIVPFVRSNRERSMSLDAVLEHAKRLSDENVKELILLGQNVNSYHDKSSLDAQQNGRSYITAKGFGNMWKNRHDTGYRFVDVLQAVADINPEMRVRFTSPHPKDFPNDVLHCIAGSFNICSSLHVPAQSGSSSVLERMRRGYSSDSYMELIDTIRDTIPHVSISSDFITGFCGETPEEHLETLKLMKYVKYDKAYMFAYSMREKTAAHRRYIDDIPTHMKQSRLKEMIDLFFELLVQKIQKDVGLYHTVLIEGVSKKNHNKLYGLTDTNKICVFDSIQVTSSLLQQDLVDLKVGDYVIVRIDSAGRKGLQGSPISRTTLTEIKDICRGANTVFEDLNQFITARNNVISIQH